MTGDPWCAAAAKSKKEVLFHKAVKEIGAKDTYQSMGLEMLGIVKRKVWRPIYKKLLTKSQRKKILPRRNF